MKYVRGIQKIVDYVEKKNQCLKTLRKKRYFQLLLDSPQSCSDIELISIKIKITFFFIRMKEKQILSRIFFSENRLLDSSAFCVLIPVNLYPKFSLAGFLIR